jgi:hypothetical protein
MFSNKQIFNNKVYMKKVIFTESQIKNIVKNLITEQTRSLQGTSQQSKPSQNAPQQGSTMGHAKLGTASCDEKLLEQIPIKKTQTIQKSEEEIKRIISTGKFKVKNISGVVTLNNMSFSNKDLTRDVIITPKTKIKICGNSSIFMSSNVLTECKVYLERNQLVFDPQHA